MKRNLIIIVAMLLASFSWAYSNLPQQLPQTKHERLMVSHLPQKLHKILKLPARLSYATGHEFYDTPIKLLDDKGNLISFKNKFNTKKQYKVESTGETHRTIYNIWFFTSNGNEPKELDWSVCTAEVPCKLTQNLIDEIHKLAPGAQLWVANGKYDLPTVNQQKLHPKLLEFHHFQYVVGRTKDFRHIAYENDRPLMIGTLSFNDYQGHEGIDGTIYNLIIRSSDNYAQMGEYYMNTNVYSTGTLTIGNCDLEKTATRSFTNVTAAGVTVMDSNLYGENLINEGGENIRSEGYVYILDSTLKIRALSSTNVVVDLFTPFPFNMVHIHGTTIENQGCESTGIQLQAVPRFDFNMSTLKVSKGTFCENYDATGSVYAIALVGLPSEILDIAECSIFVSANKGKAFGIERVTGPLMLDKNRINIQSAENDAIAINSTHELEFIRAPSYILVSSPTNARSINAPSVLNNSEPRSRCAINDEISDCGN